ncbi:hypothetical protein IWX91DRAFT_346187, partial [Phyllosticta citricarpa]
MLQCSFSIILSRQHSQPRRCPLFVLQRAGESSPLRLFPVVRSLFFTMLLPKKLPSLAGAALVLALSFSHLSAAASSDCSCGFYDDSTGNLFTESLIQYFNETSDLSEFIVEDFEHKVEKSWNSKYRQGASADNVVANGTSLELYCDPSTSQHLVNGASIRSKRRDILHGTFRSYIRGPQSGMGGSSMTMRVLFNETESLEMNMMNTDSYSDAWVNTLMEAEWPDRSLGINYTVLGNSSVTNGTVWPYDYMELRMDWTEKEIRWWVAGNNSRNATKKEDGKLPITPAPLYFRHWSTGNTYTMEGPPNWRSVANVGWFRAFFNSSVMTTEQHEEFDQRCTVQDACSVDDMSLRLISNYSTNSTVKYKHHEAKGGLLTAPIYISVICVCFSTLLLIHAFLLKIGSKKQSGHGHGASQPKSDSGSETDRTSSPVPPYQSTEGSFVASSGVTPHQTRPSTPERRLAEGMPRRPDLTPYGSSGPSTPLPRYQSTEYMPRYTSTENIGRYDEDVISPVSSTHTLHGTPSTQTLHGAPESGASSIRNPVVYTNSALMSDYALSGSARDSAQTLVPKTPLSPFSSLPKSPTAQPWSPKSREKLFGEAKIREIQEKEQKEHPLRTTQNATTDSKVDKIPTAKKQRVDYLAGLVALCSLFVTLIHFHLTYVPAVVIPGAPQHYKSELWAQKLISPFIMNQMWLGVFFTTSTRFLSARYFREGKLDVIAERAVKRTPRLLIPVTAMVLFEYFWIDVGATKYLEYVPSISWSTWAYVSKFPDPGHFISEVLELIYLIPNAVPQLTYNYCTGVLWTIAVQLQGSWVVLLGAVLVREIKTPWKRFGYYFFCVVNNWYARNWGTFFWLGLMLTDLDITYKWRKWLYPRPAVYYPLISFCVMMTCAGFLMNLLPQWFSWNFSTHENEIHPDQETGKPLGETERGGYPNYYEPRFNMLLFAVGMQAIVELSTVVQKMLSFKLLVWVFPHIFTIYLIHGFIFWSWGSWVLYELAKLSLPYWLMMLVTGLTSYAWIFLSLPIITPAIEILGRDITIHVWEEAVEKPPPRRATLFPFAKDYLGVEESAVVAATGATTAATTAAPSEKDSPLNEKHGELDERKM